jgi:hypothetical protein
MKIGKDSGNDLERMALMRRAGGRLRQRALGHIWALARCRSDTVDETRLARNHFRTSSI